MTVLVGGGPGINYGEGGGGLHKKEGAKGGELAQWYSHSSASPKVPGSIPGPVSYRGHG